MVPANSGWDGARVLREVGGDRVEDGVFVDGEGFAISIHNYVEFSIVHSSGHHKAGQYGRYRGVGLLRLVR